MLERAPEGLPGREAMPGDSKRSYQLRVLRCHEFDPAEFRRLHSSIRIYYLAVYEATSSNRLERGSRLSARGAAGFIN